jgi:hypothetical protein
MKSIRLKMNSIKNLFLMKFLLKHSLKSSSKNFQTIGLSLLHGTFPIHFPLFRFRQIRPSLTFKPQILQFLAFKKGLSNY